MANQANFFRNDITGKAIRLGDSVNTDLIFPGRYLGLTDPHEMAKHALEGLGQEVSALLGGNVFVVAGTNFGCGSSREHAVTCLKYAGVIGVIAKGFARIFFRNAINAGFLVVQCPAAVDKIANGDVITASFKEGKIAVRGEEFSFPPLPPAIMDILETGGLVNYTRRQLKKG